MCLLVLYITYVYNMIYFAIIYTHIYYHCCLYLLLPNVQVPLFSLQLYFCIFLASKYVGFIISLSISPKKLFKMKFQVPKYLEIVFTCGNFG